MISNHETYSNNIESFPQNLDGKNRGGTEPKKKVKKLRSIKLSRLPSLRARTRQAKSPSGHCPSVFSGYAASSEQSTPMEMSDSSATNENYEVPSRRLTRRSSVKPMKNITRIPSMKIKRPSIRKLSGGADMKKKLKKARSIKLSSFDNSRPSRNDVNSQRDKGSMISSSNAESSPHYLKPTSSSDSRKVQFQASSCDLESSFSSDQNGKYSSNATKPNSAPPSNKSFRGLTRTSSLRPLRIITKMGSLKSKRPSMNKCSQVSPTQDSSVHRATCSSALKGSKFPDHVKLQPEGNESEGISSMKVCPYTFCSLHGHHHANLPPLKRFVSMRRRLLKTQKSMKSESRPPIKSKRSGNKKKGIQTSHIVCSRDPAAQETADDSRGISSITGKVGSDLDILIGESSYPHLSSKNNLGRTNEFFATEECIPVITLPASKGKKMEACTSNKITGEPPNEFSGMTSNCLVQSTETNNVAADAVSEPLEEPTSSREEKKEDSEADYGFPQGFSPSGDSTPTSTNDVTFRTKMEKQKNNGLWHLIYQHMVTGLTAEAETKQEVDKEEHAEDTHLSHEVNSSGSHQGFSETDGDAGMEDHGAGSQKIELSRSDAVKLVQQAFDKILSEIPDHLSDNQSIASDIASEQELIQKNVGEDEELSISTSSGSAKDSIEQDPDEMQYSEEEKLELKEGNKSTQKMPKNWSNLKKIIILRRFVKALEKVRNFNPRKPRYLPVEPDPEAEKINLRHRMMEGRKNSEEWMLDYALQHVISTLAPSQKKKVALLVQAFETVSPLPDIGTHLRSDTAASSHSTPVQACIGSQVQIGDKLGKENATRVLLERTTCPEISLKESLDQVSDFCTADLIVASSECCEHKEAMSVSASEANDRDLTEEEILDLIHGNGKNNSILTEDQTEPVNFCSLVPEEHGQWDKSSLKCSSDEKIPANGKTFQEFPGEATLNSGSEANDDATEYNHEKLESSNSINAASDSISDEQSDKPRTPRAAREEEARPECGFPQGSPPLKESELNHTTVIHETKLEKERYTRLWYMLYKHMVSGKTTESGSQLLLERAGKEEQNDDDQLLGRNTSDSHSVVSEKDQVTNMENLADGKETELQQIEAIKLVEEAIDEIPLPETQDDSPDDHQSITRNIIPDQEVLEEKHSEEEKLIFSTSTDSSEDSFGASNSMEKQNRRQGSKEIWLHSNNTNNQEEAETASKTGNESKPQMRKSWSNLKKVILLRRFVKALEKVRKFNPREPQYLSLNPDPEAEKVHLRPQNIEDRKHAEEWMLDYALQQVVAKLTPARRRKVELLVEAFESVIPTIGS